MASARIQFLSPATGYIELTQDIIVPLSFGLGDIRDISKRTGAFSKSIVIPGTKQNKDILSHLYDLNIVTGTFDVNILQKAIIIDEAGSILFNNGIVQLIDVKKINNTFTNEEEISFTLLVKDTTGDFITSMASKELRDLDFSEFNHRFDQVNVVDSWDNTYVDGFKYLMPYIDPIGEATDNIFHLTEFRPATYARQYWDKIWASNGYTYTWSSMDSIDIQFSKLLHPYNGDVPKLTQDTIDYQEVIASASTPFVGVSYTAAGSTLEVIAIPSLYPWYANQFAADIEMQDNLGDYDPITGLFMPSYDAQTPGGITFEYDINYDVIIIAPPTVTTMTNESTVVGTPLTLIPLNVVINQTTGNSYRSAMAYHEIPDVTTFATGPTTIVSGAIATGVNTVPNITAFNVLNTQIGIQTSDDTVGNWFEGAVQVFGVEYKIVVNSITVRIKPASTTQAGYGSLNDLNQFVPEKVKQADYIKSICNMFNLFIIPDEDNSTNLIIKSRNEYYDGGPVYDATRLLNKNIEQTIEFLPDVTAKSITLTYKQDTDVANKGYFDNTSEIYGQLKYTFDSEYVKNIQTKELIFSPTPNLNNDIIGANLPYLSGAAPKTNLRILYDGGMLDCTGTGFKINEVGNIYSSGFTQYPFMGHFDKPTNPTYDLNFGQCDYYFYDNFNYITSNNLYNKFWKRTLDGINNGKLLTVYFNINSTNIDNFKLDTKIYLKQYNKYFVINKIIDFNINSKKATKVELITYDDNIKLRRFKGPVVPIKNPIKVPHDSVILTPIKHKGSDRFNYLNNDETGFANIKGFNNYVSRFATNAVIVGSNNNINAVNAIVYGDGQIVEFPNENINGPTNQPSSPTSSDLNTILGNGNTTGPQFISVDSGYGLQGTDGGTRTDTITIDPQGLGYGTGINSEDTSSLEQSLLLVGPGGVNIVQNTSSLTTSQIYISTNQVFQQATDNISITDTISVDPLFTGNGTGINSTDTVDSGNINITPTLSSISVNNTKIEIEKFKISEIIDGTSGDSLIEKIGNGFQTTNATPYIINTFVPSISSVYEVEAIVRGIRTNWGTACTFRIVGSFRVNGFGVVTQLGKQFIVENNEFTTANAVLSTDGTNILVTITGEAAKTINWSSTVISNIG